MSKIFFHYDTPSRGAASHIASKIEQCNCSVISINKTSDGFAVLASADTYSDMMEVEKKTGLKRRPEGMGMEVEFMILDDRITPDMLQPSTPGSAGIDLRYMGNSPLNLWPGRNPVLVGVGFAMHLADSRYAAMLLPRSGLGHKGLVLGNLVGLVDSDYQGEIKVSAWNRSNQFIVIEPMERIAQMIIVPVIRPTPKIVTEWEKTHRGVGGFGSSGVS